MSCEAIGRHDPVYVNCVRASMLKAKKLVKAIAYDK